MIKLWDDNTKEITDHPGMVELNPDTGGITFMAELNNENGGYKMGDELKQSLIDNLGETFYRSMTCMKCGKMLKECLCLDLKCRLEKLRSSFKQEEKL